MVTLGGTPDSRNVDEVSRLARSNPSQRQEGTAKNPENRNEVQMTKRARYSLMLCGLLSLALSCRHGTPGSPVVAVPESEVRSATEGNAPKKSKYTDTQAGEQQMAQYSGGFRLTIPSRVCVQRTEPADFVSYSFTNEGKSILLAYVGNQPNFLFVYHAIGPETIAQLNGLACKRVQCQKGWHPAYGGSRPISTGSRVADVHPFLVLEPETREQSDGGSHHGVHHAPDAGSRAFFRPGCRVGLTSPQPVRARKRPLRKWSRGLQR